MIMNNIINKKKIEELSKLMKIEIDDYDIYVNDITKILDYFNMLDTIDIETTNNYGNNEISFDNTRNDEYIPYDDNLINNLKHHKNFIRSPNLK